MKKFLFFLITLFLVGVVLVVWAKDFILKAAVERGVAGVTGFQTHVDSLKYDFPSALHIEGLEIDNPEGFSEKIFVHVPEIYVSLVLSDLLGGRGAHLPEVRLNIKEVHLEKNHRGVSNVELLRSVGGRASQQPSARAKEKPKAEEKPPMPFLLERLELTIRNVSYQDRSGIIGVAPVNKLAVDLRVERQVFVNITDPQTLVNLILAKILKEATFGRLLNLSPEKLLGQDLSQFVSTGREFVSQQTKVLGQQVESAGTQVGSLIRDSQVSQKTQASFQESMGEAKTFLGGTASTSQQKLSSFLGKLKALQSADETSGKTQ